MDCASTSTASRAATLGLIVYLCAVALALGGCARREQRAIEVGNPEAPIRATESFGTLTVVIPEALPVRSVMAAAEACLRDRGYTVTTRRTTDEGGRLVARAPARELGRTWTVESRVTHDGGTSLSVDPGGLDQQAGGEAMLDAILRRMGR